MLHGDWQIMALNWVLRIDVEEAWFNHSLFATVGRNRHTGLWHYSINNDAPDIKAPCHTRPWAMLLAQEERLRRPEITDPLWLLSKALERLCDSMRALQR